VKKLDILISDLTHTAQGINSHTFPLGASYVLSHAKKKFGSEFNFKLFKFPDNLSAALLEKLPAMLCFSNFSWNLELSYKFSYLAKCKNPNIVTVFGGPNFPTDQDEKLNFLKNYPAIDFYIELEGELGFVDLLQNLINHNFNSTMLKRNEKKIINTCYLYEDRLISGEIERIKDINIVPSPYLTGEMDEFFNYPLIPLLETTRGCPFSCTFCADGLNIKNKICRYDPQRTKDELNYIAKRVKNMNDLIIADLNFGMYKHDVETAKVIESIQKKYNYPTVIDTPAGKNMPDRTIEVAKIMKGWLIGGAMQSTDPDVLKSIKRSNISNAAYKKLIDFGNRKDSTYAEIILGLPSDTKKRHLESLRTCLDTNVSDIRVHQAILLIGTEMASKADRKKFGLKTKFRTITGSVGKYTIFGKKYSVAEIEEIIVGSDILTIEDYVECRIMNLIVRTFYNNNIFEEVYAMLKSIGISIFDCLIYIKEHPELYSEKTKQIIKSYVSATIDDLFKTREEANKYVLSPKIIDKYIGGELGANESMVHLGLMLNEFNDTCTLMFRSVYKLLDQKKLLTKKIKNYLFDLEKFTLMRKNDFLNTKSIKNTTFKYNFETIRNDKYLIDHNTIEELKTPLKFNFFHSDEQKEYIANAVKLYSAHAHGTGKIYSNTNMKSIFRSFAISRLDSPKAL